MTSFVLHMAIIIIFAALAVKIGPQPSASHVLYLSAAFTDKSDATSSGIETTQLKQRLSSEANDATSTFEPLPNPLSNPVKVLKDDAGLPPLSEDLQKIAGLVRRTTPDRALADVTLPGADVTRDIFDTQDKDDTQQESDQASAADPSDFDDIVARFIQYDIGRLRGTAGNRALREFNQLGAEAIPALVRGLNRSARLQASCPVVVISNKLEQQIQKTEDRPTIDYVLQNLGRGVPSNAPHAKRIRSLRAEIAKIFGRSKQDVRPAKPDIDESRVQRIARQRQLSRAGFDRIVKALEDEDPLVRTAACEALSTRQRLEFTYSERLRVARLLLDHWAGQRASSRKRIHDALTVLAAGLRAEGDLPRFNLQRTSTVGRRWRQWWYRYSKPSPNSASAELMRLAKYADQRVSQQLLARTIEKHPSTPEAELARKMLTADSKLKLAGELEKQRRWSEAIRLYEEVASTSRYSPQAQPARQRLEKLRPILTAERGAIE